MKCSKCKCKNILEAKYCYKCGNAFTDEYRKKAKLKTIPGILVFIENAYKTCTLQVITDTIYFKVISLIIVIIGGIYLNYTYGFKFKILASDTYEVQYNENNQEYYLITSEDETNINLFNPKQSNNIIVKHLDKDNNLLDSIEYTNTSDIKLSEYDDTNYYLISSGNNELKVYIFRGDA